MHIVIFLLFKMLTRFYVIDWLVFSANFSHISAISWCNFYVIILFELQFSLYQRQFEVWKDQWKIHLFVMWSKWSLMQNGWEMVCRTEQHPSLLSLLHTGCLVDKQQITIVLSFGFIWSGLKSMIYYTWDMHANHYTTDAVCDLIFSLKLLN